MRRTRVLLATAASLAVLGACSHPMHGQGQGPGANVAATGPMSFFVTSVGVGRGGDLGGLAGADAHCQRLATAAGGAAASKTWRAYLSVPGRPASATNPQAVPSINARDRIGQGPWYNAKGVLIASDLTQLHNGNNLSKEASLDERGNLAKGRGDQPNEHDMLTGSREDGTAFGPTPDTTCRAWTSSGEGSAMLGHHDRQGLAPENWARSWNSSHPSAGCSQQQLVSTGGAGKFYCFASN